MSKIKIIVVVTGCTKGIGAAIVDEIYKSDKPVGYSVFVLGVARSQPILDQMTLKYGSENFGFIQGDVTDEETVKKVCEFIFAKQSQGYNLKSVVFNAGVLEPVGTIKDQSENQKQIGKEGNSSDDSVVQNWKNLFEVNYFSIVNMTMHLLPYFDTNPVHFTKNIFNEEESKNTRKEKSLKYVQNIIFVSSGASVKPYKSWGAYGASKSAINHFAATLAAEQEQWEEDEELKKKKQESGYKPFSDLVRTISVAPGVVDTEMQNDIRNKFNNNMPSDFHQRFVNLYQNKELLSPNVPGKVYAKLALYDIPPEYNGKYMRYNEI